MMFVYRILLQKQSSGY